MRRDADIQHLSQQSVLGCWTRTMEQSSITHERRWLIVQWIPAVVKDISVCSVWTVGPWRSVNFINCTDRNIRTYLLTYRPRLKIKCTKKRMLGATVTRTDQSPERLRRVFTRSNWLWLLPRNSLDCRYWSAVGHATTSVPATEICHRGWRGECDRSGCDCVGRGAATWRSVGVWSRRWRWRERWTSTSSVCREQRATVAESCKSQVPPGPTDYQPTWRTARGSVPADRAA